MVRSLQRAAEKPEAARFDIGLLPIPQRYPAIARWMGAVEALPGYDRTFPPTGARRFFIEKTESQITIIFSVALPVVRLHGCR
jgi:hypothetical protein